MSSHNSAQKWSCPNCSEEIEPQFNRCWKCGSDKEGKIDADFNKYMPSYSETKSADRDRGSGISLVWIGVVWVGILTFPLGIYFLGGFLSTGVPAAFVISGTFFTLAWFALLALVVRAIYSDGKRAGRRMQ